MNDCLKSIDYNSLVIDNEYLFKGYLILIKKLKFRINKGCDVEPRLIDLLENKLLLKIIDVCLDKDSSQVCDEEKQEIKEIIMKIYAFIANEYAKSNNEGEMNYEFVDNYEELRKDVPNLIAKLKTQTNIEFDSEINSANQTNKILDLFKLGA